MFSSVAMLVFKSEFNVLDIINVIAKSINRLKEFKNGYLLTDYFFNFQWHNCIRTHKIQLSRKDQWHSACINFWNT